MTPSEKVAYLKGLAEGMELDTEKGEGKLLAKIIDVLEDLAFDLEDVGSNVDELNEGLDAVSDDLEDLEHYVYDSEDDDDDDDEEEFCAVCPHCGWEIPLSEDDIDNGVVTCPICDSVLELDFDEDGEDKVTLNKFTACDSDDADGDDETEDDED